MCPWNLKNMVVQKWACCSQIHLSSHRSFCWIVFTNSMPFYLEEGCFNNLHYGQCLPCNWVFFKCPMMMVHFSLKPSPFLVYVLYLAKTHLFNNFFFLLYDGDLKAIYGINHVQWSCMFIFFGLDQGYNFLMFLVGLLGFFDWPYFISNVIRSLWLLFAFHFVVFLNLHMVE